MNDPVLPPFMYSYSHIDQVRDETYMEILITKIIEDSCAVEFLSKAKHLLKLLESGHLKSDAEAYMISSVVHEFFHDPCFLCIVGSTLEEDYVLIDGLYSHSNHHSRFDRMTLMKEDWYFSTLMSSLSDGTIATAIRVCLSILIGHWIDRGELRELDKRMGVNYFGRKMDSIAYYNSRAEALMGKKLETDEFSYIIESASEVENMELLRNELVNKYGEGRLDIEAILDEVKSDLINLVHIDQNYLGYDGKKARIDITITNGIYSSLSMNATRRL